MFYVFGGVMVGWVDVANPAAAGVPATNTCTPHRVLHLHRSQMYPTL